MQSEKDMDLDDETLTLRENETLIIYIEISCNERLMTASFTPTSKDHRSLLVVYVFTSTKSPRGPRWNEGHRPKVRQETSVLEVPAQEQHEHSFFSSSSNTFITCFLYTVHRYRTSPGAPDLWRGWADSKAVHRME